MQSVNMTIGFANLACSAIAASLALPFAFGKTRSRILYTLQAGRRFSGELVEHVNRFFGQRFLTWGVGLAATGAAAFFLPLTSNPALAFVLAVAPLILLVPFIESKQLAGRLYRTETQPVRTKRLAA